MKNETNQPTPAPENTTWKCVAFYTGGTNPDSPKSKGARRRAFECLDRHTAKGEVAKVVRNTGIGTVPGKGITEYCNYKVMVAVAN